MISLMEALPEKMAQEPSVYQRVSALLSVQAREAHTAVEETSVLHARRAAIVTDETVTINGKQVHLG